eukprot:7083856-Heterocapsa_arctica.AAC.1
MALISLLLGCVAPNFNIDLCELFASLARCCSRSSECYDAGKRSLRPRRLRQQPRDFHGVALPV